MSDTFQAKTGEDLNLTVKRVSNGKLEFVMYNRTVVGNALTLEIIFKVGDVEFLVRTLTAFTGNNWVFSPQTLLIPEGNLIFRTVGAGAADKHAVQIGISE